MILIILYWKTYRPEDSYIAKGPKYYRHIYDVKSSRLEHDLPILVNDRVISRGLYLHETSHSEIFARILFSRIALKDIFATLKIRD